MRLELILPFLLSIEAFLLDDGTSEIRDNLYATSWYERDGNVGPEARVQFDSNKLRIGLAVITNHFGKTVDEDNPSLHARLPHGSRIAAVALTVALPSAALTIRKITSPRFTADDLIARGTLPSAYRLFEWPDLNRQHRQWWNGDCKVLAIHGYHRDAKHFLSESLLEADHAA